MQPVLKEQAHLNKHLKLSLRTISRLRTQFYRFCSTLFVFFLSLGVLTPIAWVLFSAVKSAKEVPRNPLGFPVQWHWENFPEAWEVGHFSRYFMNSIYILIPTVIIVLVLSLLAAYPFATMRLPGKQVAFILILLGLAIPLDILVVPLYYDIRALGLQNTYWAIILPLSAKILPFGVLLLRSFIEELPGELLDAGKIDGCSNFGILRYIVVPLSFPALTSLLVFSAMWTWNLFVLPVVLIQEESMRTLPIALNFFQGRYSTNVPLLMAGAAISSVPIILIYIMFQRQFVRGIASGAIKA